MNEIMVSICCLTYNHKNYIKKALDSFLMQKTNFRFEILINDDCSTDGTIEIIKEYEAKYPDIIKPLFHSENQYSKGPLYANLMSINYNFPRAKGKYIAMCEGDDYWSDENKLQSQFDVMESHSDCAFCAHSVRCVNEDGSPTEKIIPDKSHIQAGIISSAEAVNFICKSPYLFQTSSYFFRNGHVREIITNTPEFFKYCSSTDVLFMLYFSSKGKVCFIDKEMSCYRLQSSSSIMSNLNSDDDKKKEKVIYHYNEYLKSLHNYNEFTQKRFNTSVTFAILKAEYHTMLIKGEYKHLFDKKYKDVAPLFLSKASKKERFKLRLLALLKR